MKSNEERFADILERLSSLAYVKSTEIPAIHLYMDQVTTFMDEHLKTAKRSPENKALTKTMINNYAKNNLLPPPIKKKYSREHMILLLFIYYYKNMLSLNDIEQLLKPLISNHFENSEGLDLCDIYEEVIALEKDEREKLTADIAHKYAASAKTFLDAPDEERGYLQLFAFISGLSFDVYLKKQMIEMIIDQLRSEQQEREREKPKNKR